MFNVGKEGSMFKVQRSMTSEVIARSIEGDESDAAIPMVKN